MPTLPSELIARVADAFGLTPADLTGPSRARRHFAARAAAAWLLRQRYPDLGLVAIGQLLGGRDHTTVMNAIARADARRATDRAYRALLDQIGQARALRPAPPEATAQRALMRWAVAAFPWQPLAA